MEALHRQNAARLKEIIVEHGWPDRDLVGDEDTLATWFIAQHAIGDPEFQRQALKLLQEKVRQECPLLKKRICSTASRCMRVVLNDTEPSRSHVQMANTDGGRWNIPKV